MMTRKKLDIDRTRPQGDTARERLKFCLDTLEKQGFTRGINWSTQITKRLTLEEIIGAMVSSEQHLISEYEGSE